MELVADDASDAWAKGEFCSSSWLRKVEILGGGPGEEGTTLRVFNYLRITF